MFIGRYIFSPLLFYLSVYPLLHPPGYQHFVVNARIELAPRAGPLISYTKLITSLFYLPYNTLWPLHVIKCLQRPIDYLYRGRDSNSQAIKHRFLRPACLPIPPPGHLISHTSKNFLILIISYYDINITSCLMKAKPVLKTFNFLFARVERFELPTTVLETGMIPFHHTRVFEFKVGIEPTSMVLQTIRLPKPT